VISANLQSQPRGDVVDSYTISYTSVIDQCIGRAEFMSTGSISGIDGSVRTYTLTNLEEDSELSITIEAFNGAGRATSSTLKARTSVAGNLVGGFMHYGSTNFTYIKMRYILC